MNEQKIQRYELLYIVPTTFSDDELGTVEAKVSTILEKDGASIDKVTRLGKLKFAYPIKNQRHGHYVLVHFTTEPSKLSKIEEHLRITDEVLRHMIVKAEETDPKFTLVQFQEVNIEVKEELKRKRKQEQKVKSEEKRALEEKPSEEQKPITEAEVEEKIESALKEDIKDV
jgi:small subunit ribosomal protein S6